jgi:AraC family transcriptional regulator
VPFDQFMRRFAACRSYGMTIETVELPATAVVGMAIRTRPMSPEIPALWPRFVPRRAEIAHSSGPEVTYGVMRSDGDTLYYLAGVAVTGPGLVPAGMESIAIPAGEYALFRYPLSRLGEGFGEIFERLLPASGFAQIPGLPLFERYDEDFCPDKPASLVEIGIPVRRK